MTLFWEPWAKNPRLDNPSKRMKKVLTPIDRSYISTIVRIFAPLLHGLYRELWVRSTKLYLFPRYALKAYASSWGAVAYYCVSLQYFWLGLYCASTSYLQILLSRIKKLHLKLILFAIFSFGVRLFAIFLASPYTDMTSQREHHAYVPELPMKNLKSEPNEFNEPLRTIFYQLILI